MSGSKYKWNPACDFNPCIGDCDLCPKRDNLEAGIYSDNPDDQMRYVQTTQPVDLWGYAKTNFDLVEVTRCRDCIYRHKEFCRNEWLYGVQVHDFGYCDRGKKKCSTQ